MLNLRVCSYVLTPLIVYIILCIIKMRRSWGMLYMKRVNIRIRECIQKFPDWPPGARTANGTALCH
jgi:hypothetical protein